MRIYGYDDVGVARGELLAADIKVSDLDFGLELLAGELCWQEAFYSFREAHKTLLLHMKTEDVDPDLIRVTKNIKARDVPLVEAI